MQKKHQRLTGKDINYLLKRGKKRAGKHFLVYAIPQYHHRSYSQWSITISVKIDKRAVKRNYIKRVLSQHLAAVMADRQHGYKKYFIMPHKHMVDQRKQLIATGDKTTIRNTILSWWSVDIPIILSV